MLFILCVPIGTVVRFGIAKWQQTVSTTLYQWSRPVRLMSALLRSKHQKGNCESFFESKRKKYVEYKLQSLKVPLCKRLAGEPVKRRGLMFLRRKRRTYWLYFIYVHKFVGMNQGVSTPERPVSRSWTLFYSFCLCSRRGQACCCVFNLA